MFHRWIAQHMLGIYGFLTAFLFVSTASHAAAVRSSYLRHISLSSFAFFRGTVLYILYLNLISHVTTAMLILMHMLKSYCVGFAPTHQYVQTDTALQKESPQLLIHDSGLIVRITEGTNVVVDSAPIASSVVSWCSADATEV
jgi:hypothetical protein